MIWKPPLWIFHHFLAWVPVLALWVFAGSNGSKRPATELGDGRIEFRPKKIAYSAWLMIVVFLAYETTELFLHSQWKPLNLAIAICLGFLTLAFLHSFPGTVVITDDTIQQIFWFRRNKRVGWEYIVEINTGGKSRTVTITDADGNKIVHSNQLPDRSRLLREIEKHCGDNLPPDFPAGTIAKPQME